MNITEKLMKVQSALKAPKGQYNSFGKYKYRSCEDILTAVKPLLEEVGAVIILSDEVVQIGDRFYIKARAEFKGVEQKDFSISNTAYAREDEAKKGMDGSQITGTASSYARKYALNGLLLIDDTKDADTDESHNEREGRRQKAEDDEKTQKVKKQTIDNVKIETLMKKCLADKVNGALVCGMYKVESFAQLTEGQFAYLVNHWDEVKKRCSSEAR